MSLASCILNPIGCATNDVTSGLLSVFTSGITSWVGRATAWGWRQLSSFLGDASSPAVVVTTARPEFQTLLEIAPIAAVCALGANALTFLRRSDVGGLLRETLITAPLVIIATVCAIPIASGILSVTNALCATATVHAASAADQLANASSGLGAPGFDVLLLDLAGVLASLLLWFELILRNAALSLLLVLSPVVLALALWAPMRRLALRLVETFVALALAKFVIVVALALALSTTTTDSPNVLLTGVAVALLATLSPYLLLRLVPLVESSAAHAFEGVRQRVTRATAKGVTTAVQVGSGMLPAVEPTPPERPEDLGIPWWPDSPWPEFPPLEGTPPAEPPEPPIGEPTLRTGHRAYRTDEYGPVIGWHFDE